ncbi:MAG TPA: molybdopterin oxidoreductase family protein [Gemmatimonadales bacterium]|nr:molybdopterin oxidoreductase family protein [Gemmatimonadales bacterium]
MSRTTLPLTPRPAFAVRTHCPYCAFQCGVLMGEGDGQPDRVMGDPHFPVNNGQLCVKGWTSHTLLRHPRRLTTPLVRDNLNEPFRSASWDAALDLVADRVAAIRAEHSPEAIGVFGSGALTNEKTYLLGKFARVAVGTPHIDYNGRYCMSSAAAAQNRAFGLDRGLPFPLADIEHAEVVWLAGSNAADTLPPIMQWFDRQKANGGRLIVSDPRRTPTARAADLFLQLTPGSDLALANGLLAVAVEEGLIDGEYIAARTNGFDAVRRAVLQYHPARVERLTGIPESQLRTAARWLASAKSTMILSGRGAEQHSKGVDAVHAHINLLLALGKVGKSFSGYGCLTGQGNGQGGREHGQKADQLPGYRFIEVDAHREAVAEVWGVDPASLPRKGRSAFEMLDSIGPLSPSPLGGEGWGGGYETSISRVRHTASVKPTPHPNPPPQGGREPEANPPPLGGREPSSGIRALFVMGSNVAVASPDMGRVESRLRALDFLAVCDSFENETTALAHVILPVYQWAEEEGTTTNLEGRVIRRRITAKPPTGVRGDIDVLRELATRLGVGDKFEFYSPRDVFDELRRATAGAPADYSGITYERIDAEDGVFWPCPAEDHAGTPRLFAKRFHHPDGRARFFPVEHRPAGEEPDESYPIYFTTGRYKEHYNSGAQTRLVAKLNNARPNPMLQIHPRLARRHGIVSGNAVVLESRRGKAEFVAELTADVRPDTVFAPIHWGGKQAANLLTNPALDPVSRMPEFKLAAVRIAAVRRTP